MSQENFFETDKIQKLYDLARKKNIPHALLFESDSKEFSISVAINISKILMCRSSQDVACKKCDSCKKVLNKSHPDIEIIKPQNNQKTIGIQVIRLLKQNAYITPNESDYKIYIFPDASIITPQAQNAFLKILEEPPKSVIFIMVCPNRLKLLDTVVSRLTCYKICSNENHINDNILSETKKFIKHLLNKNELEILKISSSFSKNRVDFIKFLGYSKDLILKDFVLNSIKTIKILDILGKCENLIEKNINMSLLPCYLCSNLISTLHSNIQ